MNRRVDVFLDPAEMLYRRVSRSDLKPDGTPRHTSLSLHVSMSRHSFDPGGVGVVSDQKNGVVGVSVAEARGLQVGGVATDIIDSPNPRNESHAMVVFLSDVAPGTGNPKDVENLKRALAAKMKVTTQPTK